MHLSPAFESSQPLNRCGTYKLPASIYEMLENRLKGFRNRETTIRLATWLARMNAGPRRIDQPFPMDRRALSKPAREDSLGLTENEVRGAMKRLEEIGFLARMPPEGSLFKRTRLTQSGVHRKPLFFTFGVDFLRMFQRVARVKPSSPKGRVIIKTPVEELAFSYLVRGGGIPLGEQPITPGFTGPSPKPGNPLSPLELALARFRDGVEGKTPSKPARSH